MDCDEFRRHGKEMVDYIADYYEGIRTRKVCHDIKPGYMKELIPLAPPEEGENWDDIIGDVERVIMPGVGIPMTINDIQIIKILAWVLFIIWIE